MNPSHSLLQQYAHEGNDAAFRELVREYVDLVYAAALRVLKGNVSEAEEVAQATFTELARKAAGLREGVILSGWLYQTASHLALRRLRADERRHQREQEAVAMQALEESDQPTWTALAPVLDEAMGKLPPRERDALVLRYFEQRDHRSVGSALGLSDDAAQKCVSRALEKLRSLLQSRGIHSTASALSLVMLANALPAAPEALKTRLPGTALARAATAAGGLARWKLGLAAGLVAAGSAAPWFWQQQRILHLEMHAVDVAQRVAAASGQVSAPQLQPTMVAKREVTDLVAEAARVLQGGAQHFTATATAMNLLAEIPDAEISAALQEILKVRDVGAQTLLFKYLLSRWVETHPSEALQFATQSLPFACRSAGMDGLLDAWGGNSTAAATAAVNKSGTLSFGNNSLTTSLYRGLASKNLAQAFARLAELNSQGERGFALRGIMERITAPAQRDQALELIGKLTDPPLQLQAKRSLVERWAEQDAPSVAQWVLQLPAAYERFRCMDSLGLVWLQRDPQAAADWWIEQAPGADTLTKIVNIWAHDDPNAAGTWLRQHAVGPEGDDARMTFARQVQELDPESALAWAETITHPVLKEATVDHIVRSWRLRDATNAEQTLEKSSQNWSADRRQRLNLNSTQPP